MVPTVTQRETLHMAPYNLCPVDCALGPPTLPLL